MNAKLNKLFEESIKLELNVSELYHLFSMQFPGDREFWKKLSDEEDSHANLLKTARDILSITRELKEEMICFSEMICSSLEALTETNSKIELIQKDIHIKTPDRMDAFNIAYSLENSAGEIHFQQMLDREYNASFVTVFKKLNGDDKNHAQKIMDYMKDNNITFYSAASQGTNN